MATENQIDLQLFLMISETIVVTLRILSAFTLDYAIG